MCHVISSLMRSDLDDTLTRITVYYENIKTVSSFGGEKRYKIKECVHNLEVGNLTLGEC